MSEERLESQGVFLDAVRQDVAKSGEEQKNLDGEP
jgi:hypothetical protein